MAMRADCQAMHDRMMAGHGEAMGDMSNRKMMPPEMMEKHQSCMQMKPEMKAKIQEKSATHKAAAMDKDKKDQDQMGAHCAMMLSVEDETGQ
jgi:hypothetical protein